MGCVLRGLATTVVTGIWLWMIPAVWFQLSGHSQALRITAALAWAVVPPLVLLFAPNRGRTRRLLEAFVLFAWLVWLAIPPSNQGEWAEEYARLPWAEIHGDEVTVHDVRDFSYRSETDFTPHWYDATYDLDQLDTLDFIKVHWGSEAIAHTMLSFGFSDGRHLTVSVETRRRKGQDWSSIAGFFKQYTLAYVIGDERDLIRLRTNYRHEDVYLYPTNTPKDQIRLIFVDILEAATALREHPQWYNTITDNCTTSLAKHIRKVRGRRRWDPRLLINGHTDEMGIESGWITPHGDLEETRRYYYVNPKVENLQDPEHFSQRIREGL